MKSFDDLMATATRNGDYSPLTLDTFNNLALELLADGVTAVVVERKGGQWVEIKRFDREHFWAEGYWSDLDIDNAIYN